MENNNWVGVINVFPEMRSGNLIEKGLNMKKILLIALFISAISSLAVAHSGGTNSSGCHIDHSTGIYHCH